MPAGSFLSSFGRGVGNLSKSFVPQTLEELLNSEVRRGNVDRARQALISDLLGINSNSALGQGSVGRRRSNAQTFSDDVVSQSAFPGAGRQSGGLSVIWDLLLGAIKAGIAGGAT